MNKKTRRELAKAAEAGSGSAAPVVVEKTEAEQGEVVDGHTMGELATAEEVSMLEKAESFNAGSLADAIAKSLVKAYWWSVNVSANKSPTKVAASRAYIRLEALKGSGMGIICKGQIDPAPAKKEGEAKPQAGACDFFNYGSDLDRKAPVRIALLGSLEGPEKAIKKMVTVLVAGGYEAGSEDLFVAVKAAPKFRDLPDAQVRDHIRKALS